DDDLAKRLSDAFAQHPWVEKVDQVLIEPPQHVRIRLVYRIPVLAVLINEATKEGAVLLETRSSMIGMKNALAAARAVDKRGILFPPAASLEGLPVLYRIAKAPAGLSGTPWGDARVEAAARTANFLQPYQKRLHLEDFEATEDGLVLSTPPAVRVLW